MAARLIFVFLLVILAIIASLCSYRPEIKETRLLSGAGLRVVQSHRIACSFRWGHGPVSAAAGPETFSFKEAA